MGPWLLSENKNLGLTHCSSCRALPRAFYYCTKMCEKSKSTTLSYYKIDQCWINSVCKTNKCSLEIITYLKYALDCLKKMGVQSLLRQCPNKHVFFNGGLPICALWLKMIETSHEYVPSNISFQCLNRHHCQNIHSQRQNSCFSHFLRVKHKLEKLSLNTHLCFCCCFFNAKLFCANLCKVQN